MRAAHRIVKTIFILIVVACVITIWSIFPHNSWQAAVFGVVLPIAAVIGIAFIPKGWPSAVWAAPALLESFKDWHKRNPDAVMRWQKLNLSDDGTSRLTGVNATTRAILDRFTGPPVHDVPEFPRVQWAGLSSLRGVPSIGMQADLHWGESTVGGGGTTARPAFIASVDTPSKLPRTVICRADGYRKWRVYRAFAFWKFRSHNADFDRKFYVARNSQHAAKQLISTELAQFLVDDPRAYYLPVIFENGTLSTTTGEAHIDGGMLAPMTDFLLEVLARVPAQTWAGHPVPRERLAPNGAPPPDAEKRV
jgi:hypothetical protein